MSLPQPLMFTVGLIDQITKPIAKISQGLSGLASNYQAGTMQMASGIGGIAASGYALQNALMPAIEMDRALGEVKSLGVQDDALKLLASSSYDYALKYGKSSTDFVRSSYDIQSAIAGLNASDLSRFTMSSNVLAAATKADAATITSYMGTMYGIFKNDAMQMGEGAWVERLTGMTATAVQAFKTDGKKMADAFGALGASAGLAPLQEQMAIMGTLQATMQGAESATKYKSFLAGVGKAQDALNLKFTDSNGAMLPIVDILNKIKGKYGDVINVAEGDELAKAFGSQEAVSMVKLLMNDITGLSGSINMLGKVKGMEQAEKMAAAMTDQSERLAQSWYVIRAAFGSAILPAFNSFVGKIADMGTSVIWFTDMFPNITRWLGYVAVGFTAAVAAGGLFTVMMGAGKMAMTTWGLGVMAWTGANALFTSGLASMRAVLLAVNIAMYANPISLIVAGVAALIAVVGLAIYYFDDLRAMLAGTAWGEPILFAVDAIADVLKILGSVAVSAFSSWLDYLQVLWKVLKPVAGFLLDVLVFALKVVGAVAGAVFGAIAYAVGGIATGISWLVNTISSGFEFAFNYVTDGWANVISALSDMEWVQGLISGASSVGEFFSQLWTSIKASFSDAWGWIVDNLNMLPGIDIAVNPVVEQVNAAQIPDVISQHNQQAVPSWMQQHAANDAVNYVYAAGNTNANAFAPAPFIPDAVKQQIDVQRTIPAPYTPSPLTQQLNIEPTSSPALANMMSPKFNQQIAASAQANRTASKTANTGKTMSFGDVVIHNPPKNFSLAEIADQQELMTA
ncbi:phage tail tape measure protein [Shewanella baltica]|uniref:phage tail tape measure protein n=1 Tax=Shewanella baltica TaxID=62322 RepID=UPI0039AFB720